MIEARDWRVWLDAYVIQAIQQRANLRNCYVVVYDEAGGDSASLLPDAAGSIWQAAQDALDEAGWTLKPK